MSAPIDVLADLSILANIGEYRDLRESMEKCLRPHERAGFADLLARMGDNHTAVAELIEALSQSRDALADYDGHMSNPDFRGGWDSDVGYAAYQRAGAALARVKGGAA